MARPQRWPRRLVLGSKAATQSVRMRGVVHVGMLCVAIVRYGLDL